jgi:uncharacterized sulfatase
MKYLLGLAAGVWLAHTALAADRPNFLFILADDCTHWDIGCYGGQAITPNIDRLAGEGMRFTQCFQSAPMCSPTRHALYTGISPVKSGAYPNHTFVKEGVKSIVHYLQPLGYRVALSGKKHIGPKEAFPFEYSGKNNPDMEVCGQLMKESVEAGTPFCLFATSNEPHDPWDKGDPSLYQADALTLPENWVDTPETREAMTQYLAEISYFDDQVGTLLNMLDAHGLRENTLVIVASEQGSIFPFAKWTCYDAGLRSALVARWPGKIKAGSGCDALVEYLDMVPTFIDAAGGAVPEELEGKSLLPLFADSSRAHKEYVFGEMTTLGIMNGSPHYGIRSVRSARYRLIWNFTPEMAFRNVAMKKPFFTSWEEKAKTDSAAAEWVQRFRIRPEWELYDLGSGSLEGENLADNPEMETIFNTLKAELQNWMERCGDEGQQTELKAGDRQHGGKKKAKK